MKNFTASIPLRAEMVVNPGTGTKTCYEPVFNSGCLAAAPPDFAREISEKSYAALRDEGVPGAFFVTSDVSVLPSENRAQIESTGKRYFGSQFEVVHTTLARTQNAFGLRVNQSALPDSFAQNLEDAPERVTIASITHTDPANAKLLVDTILRKNPENLGARTALTLALNDKVTPTGLFQEETGYLGVFSDIESICEATEQAQDFVVAKCIGHAAGGTNVIFLTPENIQKEKTRKALAATLEQTNLLLFRYLRGFELLRSDGLMLPSAHMRPIFVRSEFMGTVLKFSGSAVPRDLFDNGKYRKKDAGELNRILNGSSGLSTSVMYDATGKITLLTRAEKQSDGTNVQSAYTGDQASAALEGIMLPNGKSISDASSIIEYAMSGMSLQDVVCSRTAELIRTYTPSVS